MKNKMTHMFYGVVIFTMSIQLLSMMRTALLAKEFGVSSEMDAFNLANLMMIAIVNIGGAAIPTVVIPFLATMPENQTANAKRILNSYVVTIMSASLFFLIVVYIAGFIGMENFRWQTNRPFYYMTYLLTFIMGAGQLFRMYSWLLTSYLEVEGKFIWIKVAGLVAALLNFLFLLLYVENLTIYQVALSVAISFLIETLVLAFFNRKWSFRFSFAFRSAEYRRLVRLTTPSLLGAIIYQVTILLPGMLGSYFGTGYISMMTYANQMISIFQVLLITNLMSMVYPNLSRSFSHSVEVGRVKFVQYLKLFFMIVMPVVALMIVIGHEVIAILFERGNFDSTSSHQVFIFLLFLLLALPLNVFKELTFKIFYSIGDTKTPVVNSSLSIAFQILFLSGGVFTLGVMTLMISPLIVAIFAALLAVIALVRKLSFKQEFIPVAKELAKATLNAALMATVVYIEKITITTSSELINLILYVTTGVIIYGLLTLLTDFKYIRPFLPGGSKKREEMF